jgi:hypothetical protein
MTALDTTGILFFEKELLKETIRQLEMFEAEPPQECAPRELGRIRLYEDREKIQTHFLLCTKTVGAFDSNRPSHGLLGKLKENPRGASLVWQECEGIRHSLFQQVEEEIQWEGNQVPRARLTSKGRFKKKDWEQTAP